jgi:hypothetical protein
MNLQRQDLMIVQLRDIERRLQGWRGAIVIDHDAFWKMTQRQHQFLMGHGKCYTVAPMGAFV